MYRFAVVRLKFSTFFDPGSQPEVLDKIERAVPFMLCKNGAEEISSLQNWGSSECLARLIVC